MFDPTIYENLKVVFEGAVYDLDLDGHIVVTHRSDLIDLATMSRTYAVRYRLKDGRCTAEVRLSAGLVDLAGEKLEWRNALPGCKLEIVFALTLRNPEAACRNIDDIMRQVWDANPSIVQTLSYRYGEDGACCRNEIVVAFDRKIGEGQIDDIAELLEHTVRTLRLLEPYNTEE
ncbi:hypothetical protein [Paenibacillus flagellatus]|uniref:Uncharacterized protein n=1 Tax=Paenibacillus flagellatus TaxID=2211139 RepID=A0A2V5K8N4_9BACL|nr:hypothetical protein [Paenibacillus flagellatus]PYI55869.1 hypothetical protein DLM86_09145 [Paenibacillus flagellatus]